MPSPASTGVQFTREDVCAPAQTRFPKAQGLENGTTPGKAPRLPNLAGAVSACTSRLPLGSAVGGERSGGPTPSPHPSPAGKPSSNPFLTLKGTSWTLRARPWEETSLVRPYTRATALPSAVAGGRWMPPPFFMVSCCKLNTRAVCLDQAHPGLPKPGGMGPQDSSHVAGEPAAQSPRSGVEDRSTHGTRPVVKGAAGPRGVPLATSAPSPAHSSPEGCRAAVGQDAHPGSSR